MSKLLLFALLVGVCLGQMTSNPCLYSSASSKVLLPLNISASLCPGNASTYASCMSIAYKYSNFQYNGPAALKPVAGEIVMFLARYPDSAGSYHLVTMLNANVSTTMNVSMSMTGTAPANIELYDDPLTSTDKWDWNPATNMGKFTWITLPGYTDGCIIGPITFVDSYCIKAVFNQPNNAIQKISVMSGTSSSPSKIITVPYTSGSTFEFCQYPQTVTWKTDATCPGFNNGAANITLVNGPPGLLYSWTNASGATIGTGSSITGLKAGQYYAYLTDTSTNHCNAARSVMISEPSALDATISTTPFACSTLGTASATPTGGAGGYTYSWKSGSAVIGTSSSVSGLTMGAYILVLTDSCGTSTTVPFSIGTSGCCGDGICQANEMCGGTGTFCAADCGVCCPVGTYTVGMSSCVVCPAGSYGLTIGAQSCTSCPANTFNAGGNDACAACPANTQSTAGSGVCSNCPAGQIRASGETGCHTCADGSVPNCGVATCSACAAGTYSLAGWSTCQACAAGTYASSAGSSSCTTCPAGKYAAAGSSSCTSCSSGTNVAGASHPISCM